jgi:hypothetical protein
MDNYLYFLLVIGLVGIVIMCFGALVYFLAREMRVGGMSAAHSQTDLTNMMILFQTMRDILTQQKDLAREFNISIDKKVNEVRKLIQSTGNVRSELERTRRELAALSARTRKDIATLERRLQGVDGATAPETDEAVDDSGVDAESGDELDTFETVDPPLEVLPEIESDDGPDILERWRLSDEAEAAEEDGIEIEDEYDEGGNGHDVHVSEEEVEETRAAYRDLLSLQPTGPVRMRGPSTSDILDGGRASNGGQYLTPIQKRVYEYSDAGMRVPEIARELGVGKGEVRLILSLRQDRGR